MSDRHCAGCTATYCRHDYCHAIVRWQWKVRELMGMLQDWNPSNPHPVAMLRSEPVPTALKPMVQAVWNALDTSAREARDAEAKLRDRGGE